MTRTGSILSVCILILAACTISPALQQKPPPVTAASPTVFIPNPTETPAPATPTGPALTGPFSKISRSTDIFHLTCDPLEIIFDVTVNSDKVTGVAFFFRMKDKASGLVNQWSNGENMRPAGNGMFEFIFRASAIPDEARYKDAWVQYQFVGIDQNLQILGQSQIFAQDLTFTPGCK